MPERLAVSHRGEAEMDLVDQLPITAAKLDQALPRRHQPPSLVSRPRWKSTASGRLTGGATVRSSVAAWTIRGISGTRVSKHLPSPGDALLSRSRMIRARGKRLSVLLLLPLRPKAGTP